MTLKLEKSDSIFRQNAPLWAQTFEYYESLVACVVSRVLSRTDRPRLIMSDIASVKETLWRSIDGSLSFYYQTESYTLFSSSHEPSWCSSTTDPAEAERTGAFFDNAKTLQQKNNETYASLQWKDVCLCNFCQEDIVSNNNVDIYKLRTRSKSPALKEMGAVPRLYVPERFN